jgi:hypothetical protein
VKSRVGSRGAREESGDTAAFHVLGSFLGGGNSLLHGDRVLGAAVDYCVTHRVATLTSSQFGRLLLCTQSGGCLGGRLGYRLVVKVEYGASVEVVEPVLERIDSIVTDVEHKQNKSVN